MKKYTIYVVALIALGLGFIGGRILFGKTNTTTKEKDGNHRTTPSETEIWTCSMHPQIRQNEPGSCPICGMDLIPADRANDGHTMGFQMTEEAVQLANIQTTVVGAMRNSEGRTLRLHGKIEADETKSASLTTPVPGRIEKLYVSYTGEQVRKGQKIATIYSPELITAQKELLEAQKIQDISPDLLAAAKNKMKYWKISPQTIQSILDGGVIRETFDIYADHSGVVNQKKVSVGDYLGTGEVLFDVQNLSNLWALFDVYEGDLNKVGVGQTINFTTPSAPNKIFKAKITFVNPVIDPSTRASTIRAEVRNPSGRLKPEMFITGELSLVQKPNSITIPKSAVLWTGQRSVVYVKIPNMDIPSYEYREVEIGEASPAGYPVIKGLEYGEEVVTHGAFVIDASAQLNNQASMMNRNVRMKKHAPSNPLPDYTMSTPEEFKTQLTALTHKYLLVKDALVESKATAAHKTASDMMNKLEETDMSLVKDEAHTYWMKQFNTMTSHGKKIIETTDIEEQRRQFDFLSQALILSLRAFGTRNDTFYIQHCPMANDNEGADWLSQQEKILNPYFGEKMLTCGKVVDTINENLMSPSAPKPWDTQGHLHRH